MSSLLRRAVGSLNRFKSINRVCSAKYFSSYADQYPQGQNDIKVEFNSNSYKTHNLDAPNLYTYTNKDEILAIFEEMFTIRRLELKCDQYYKQKHIWGFCHLYDGQEAVCCGIEAALKPGDHIITAYREHGFQYTRGDSVRNIFAEMFGKKTGCARGKGGSMHLYFPSNNFYGGNGIVGAQVPLGTGIALASKFKGDGTVCITAMGDGAANQGQVYESFNMAKLWNLPVIYLVENNRYGMGTSIERASASSEFYTRGDYIPGIQVDGMNVLCVREATRFAADWCRSGKGPIVMEAMTYRYHGHSMSDPGISYRNNEEVQEYRTQFDPLRYVRNLMLEQKWIDETELKGIETRIRKLVDKESSEAEKDGMLTSEELATDIYQTGIPPFVRYNTYDDSLVDGHHI